MNRISRRWRRLTLTSAAIVAAGALVLTGCSAQGDGNTPKPSDEGKPITGGNLVVQISGDPGGLDQNSSASIDAVNISELIFEKLFALDNKNVPKPMLVDKYEIENDSKDFTFHLRSGVKFSDGTPLTANDVVESLKYWMRVNFGVGTSVGAITDSITAPDDATVVWKLKEPHRPLIPELTGPGTGIIKGDIAKGLTPQGFDEKQAIGTGPYKLKSWTHGQELVVERNDLYSSLKKEDTGYAGAKHAYLDTITFKMVGDADAVKNGILTGQFDYASSATPESYPSLKSNPDLKTELLTGGNLNVLILNHAFKGSLMYSQDARDALNLVVDKKAIMEATGGDKNLTRLSGSLTPKEFPSTYSTAGDKEYKAYDPEKAKELFQKAGYSDSKPIKILTTGNFPQFVQWAQFIQDELKQIGIKSDIKTYDFVTMLGQLMNEPDKWDIVPLFFNGAFPSANQWNVVQSAANPATKIEDDRPGYLLDALAAYNNATDEKSAKKAIDDITKSFWTFKPDIVLGMSVPYASYTPKLKGYDNYWYVFWNSWLAK